jgi:hypothetical protein
MTQKPPDVIRDAKGMLAGMKPRLTPGEFVFCTTTGPGLIASASVSALCLFKEDEGTTLILTREDAAALGFEVTMPMRRIVLDVFSALDGLGLTAGVAAALTAARIPCNMVAAFHHDHVFVPAAQADEAHSVLIEVAMRAAAR